MRGVHHVFAPEAERALQERSCADFAGISVAGIEIDDDSLISSFEGPAFGSLIQARPLDDAFKPTDLLPDNNLPMENEISMRKPYWRHDEICSDSCSGMR
jgi:hypothetical protein